MAKSRNTLSHVYEEGEAEIIVRLIFGKYGHLLKALDEKLAQFSQE